jgi:succinate dehydrogenase / fumarate reductase cytochrome b subunit
MIRLTGSRMTAEDTGAMTTTMAAPPIYRTSIGKKVLMATSGLVLVLFVIVHMAGNLKAWLSPRELDTYSAFLRRMGEPIAPHSWVLWIIRAIVFVAFIVHVYLAIDLSVHNRRARQHRYAVTDHVQANPASITMRWGGLALALFVVFHLANFTWGWIHPGYTFVRGAVYHNTLGAFNEWWMVVIYVAAMAALCLHMFHGTWSMFQTWGVNSQRWDRLIRGTAAVVSIAVFLGFISVPIGVLTGALN